MKFIFLLSTSIVFLFNISTGCQTETKEKKQETIVYDIPGASADTLNPNSMSQSTGSITSSANTVSSIGFLKSVGIFANIPEELIQIAEPRVLHLYSKDGRFEYLITWASADQTPEKMRAALQAGTIMNNGFISKSSTSPTSLNGVAEKTSFNVLDLDMRNELFKGIVIHDWSTSRGILVISVMSKPQDVGELEQRIQRIYQGIKIPSQNDLSEIKQKIKSERESGIRSQVESFYFNKIMNHTLINTNSPGKTTQRFELCDSGKGKYVFSNGSIVDEKNGSWDIFETTEGIPLLILLEANGKENKWQIGPHISGNVTLGNVEFSMHSAGTSEEPKICFGY
jgi:hypothetical protein